MIFLLANFISNLKSAYLNKTKTVISCSNKKVLNLCLVLEELGYISGFTCLPNNKICVHLRYYKNKPALRSLSLVSKSSSRVYFKKKNIFGTGVNSFISINGFILFNTSFSKNLLTDVELYMIGIGGEPVCVVS